MMKPAFVSVVLYVRNDGQPAAEFLGRLDRFLADVFETYEMIVVNDFSTDGTITELHRAAEALRGSVTLITLARRHGVELAMLAGLERSMGDFVFELEGPSPDFALDLLHQLFEQSSAGFDIVAAAPSRTSLRSRLFYGLINRASELEMDLSTETARLVTRRALHAMLLMREKVRYRKVLYALTGYPTVKVTYPSTSTRPRRWNRETMRLALDIVISFSDWGLRAAYYLSMGFFLFSLFAMGYVLFHYIFRDVVEGWTTIMILLSTGFAGIFFILGLLGEHLARILTEVRSRPSYSIAATVTYPDRRYLSRVAASEEL